MAKSKLKSKSASDEAEISRKRLAELLNEDLSREYQAIIAYVTYSQVLKGPEYMDIADQLEIHAKQELEHALAIARALAHTFCQAAATSRRNRSTDTCKLPV